MNYNKKIISADLFSGCGGFIEGLHWAGFKTVLAADIDSHSCSTLKNRLLQIGYNRTNAEKIVVEGDLTSNFLIQNLKNNLGETKLDLLAAGIPCQSFSMAGRAQDPNSMKKDKRNYLYKSFINFLVSLKYKPKFLIIENVLGILSAKPKGKRIFETIINEIKDIGYKISNDEKKFIFDAADFGVPQRRKRVFIVAVRNDLSISPDQIYEKINENKSDIFFCVKDAIKDLPVFFNGYCGEEILKYRKKNTKSSYVKKINSFIKIRNSFIFNHVARKHNAKDRMRYRLLSKNNWKLKDLAVNGHKDLVHHDPNHFEDRYRVQNWNKPAGTIVAHLHKDGNLFIHPDYKQERTFTVREAARIQSFPDNFFFSGSRTEQYKQVGNAVPPLLAYNLGKALSTFLN